LLARWSGHGCHLLNTRDGHACAAGATDLPHEDLALEDGLIRTYIPQVKRGKGNVTIVVLARIAKALKDHA
jgi:hypothetical protein